MKRLFFRFLVLVLAILSPQIAICQGFPSPMPAISDYPPVPGKNFVRTYIPQRATPNEADISLTNQLTHKCEVKTQYFDGIGRPLQEVFRSGVSSGAYFGSDIVNIHIYDANGRESAQYLPYTVLEPSTSNRGKLKTNPTALLSQYATLYTGEQPYSQTVFDNSPLNRVNKTMAPGSAWVGASNGVSNAYSANMSVTGDNVDIWTVGPLKTDIPVYAGLYATNSIYVTKTVDEEGVEVREYKDIAGRTVLKKQKNGTSYLQTAYIYDDFGRLRYVLTPEAYNHGITTALGTGMSSLLGGYCYKYFYDNKGRMVERTVPGKAVEYFVYDKYDRVVLYQNGNLRKCGTPVITTPPSEAPEEMPAPGLPEPPQLTQEQMEGSEMMPFGYRRIPLELNPNNSTSGVLTHDPPVYPTEHSTNCSWHFTYYDIHSRVLMTGLYSPAWNYSREAMQYAVDWPTSLSSSSGYLMYFLYYDQFNAYPTALADATIWTVNYYDDYSNPAISGVGFDPSFNSMLTGVGPYAVLPTFQSKLTKGLRTGSNVCILDPNHALTSAYTTAWKRTGYIYDDKARVIQERRDNHRGVDLITNQYNFAGSLASTVCRHSDGGIFYTNTDIVKTYNVDHYNGKSQLLTQKINSQAAEPIYAYTYDALGRVLQKSQNVVINNYRYNIRGWLTGINDAFFNTSTPNIYFKEKLMYENLATYSMPQTNTPLGPATTYTNGNISQILWQHSGAAKVRAYRYKYDPLNRVTQAMFSQRENPSGSTWTWTDAHTNYSMWNVNYDANGNITTMNQMGDPDVPSTPPIIMDQMNYSYFPNSNKLKGVADAGVVSQNPDFKDDASHSINDYEYDDNGNLTRDNNKGITVITYSHLDKPQHIDVLGKGSIDYVYDALGNRIQKKVVNTLLSPAVTTTTDYAGDFVYKNNALFMINHEEGRSRPETAAGVTTYVNDYYVKDHLTNVRSVVTANAYFGIPDIESGSTSGTYTSSGSGLGLWTGPTTYVHDYLATHEIASASVEGALFNNIDLVRALNPSSTDSSDLMAATLDGTDSATRIGTSLMLRVMPGDQFVVSARNFYESDDDSLSASTPDVVGGLLGALAGGTTYDGVPLADVPQSAQILHSAFTNPGFATAYDALLTGAYDAAKPAAFLNYLVLDEQLNIVPSQSGVIQVGPDAESWNTMGIPASGIMLEQPGYLVVFLSSMSSRLVSFDRLRITYYRGSVLEEDHYYPFGLNKVTEDIAENQKNKIKFISKELQKDEFTNAAGNKSGLEYYDFGARMQDPQIGRWNGIDQLSEKYYSLSPYSYAANDPVSSLDVDGKYIATAIGGVEYVWKNGGFYNGSTQYTGNDGFTNRLAIALNDISSVRDSKVQGRYKDVVNSGYKISIAEGGVNRTDKDGTGSLVQWTSKSDYDPKIDERTDAIGNLTHELLGHGWQEMNGIINRGDIDMGWHPSMIQNSSGKWESVDDAGTTPVSFEQKQNAVGLSKIEHDATSIESRYLIGAGKKERQWYHTYGEYNGVHISNHLMRFRTARNVFLDLDKSTDQHQVLKVSDEK